MLTYTLNGQIFRLNEDATVRISWANPACFFDKIQGDAGMGIDIPVNEHNRTILGNPERFEKLQSSVPVKIPGFEIRYGGALLLSGSLVVQSATPEAYSCWLQSDLGVLGEAVQNKNITDFSWPENQSFSNKTSYDDDSDDYGVLQIHNRGFWDSKGKEIEDTVATDEGDRKQTISALQKDHFTNFGYLVNKIKPGVGIEVSGSSVVVSPFLHLRYVVSEALRLNGWTIAGNQLFYDDMTEGLRLQKNMMVYNNFNIMGATFSTRKIEAGYWDYDLNEYIITEFKEIQVTNWGLQNFDYKDLLPKITLKDFLLGIQNTLNYIFRFRSDKKVDIIDREAIVSGDVIDLDEYVTDFWEMGEKQNARLKFNPLFDKEDALFGSGYEDLTDRLSDFGDPVATFDDLADISSPTPGELRLVIDANEIYEYKWIVRANEQPLSRIEEQFDTFGWELVSIGTQPYIYQPDNENEEIIDCPLTTLTRTPIMAGFTYTALQKGNIGQMRSAWSDFSFRCMVANSVLWPNGIDWEGEFGIFNTRWKKWAQMWATRQEVTGRFNMPLNVILYVVNNITSKFRTRAGEFIIEEIECDFGVAANGITTIKGYKI